MDLELQQGLCLIWRTSDATGRSLQEDHSFESRLPLSSYEEMISAMSCDDPYDLISLHSLVGWF